MNQNNFPDSVSSERRGNVLALGNFDGVHRGHQAVIAAALDIARRNNLAAHVLTLEPHPRTLLSSPQTPFRLTPPSVKNRLLHELGIKTVITLDFSFDLARMPAREFAEQILAQHYRAKHIVAGEDFAFGCGREGKMKDLCEWMKPYGIGVTVVPQIRDETGEIISSSRLREAIYQGDLNLARLLLGRPWSITGIIVRKEGRGRKIGIPTANIELGEFMRPPFGVYAVLTRRIGSSKRYPGVANIGMRPTVGGAREILEFHIFDFDEDIYDQEWEVELYSFLRPEQKFPDIETLHDQIMLDITQARKKMISQISCE